MGRRQRSVWIVLVVLSMSLVLGACSGDDDGGDAALGDSQGNLEAFCGAAEAIGTAGAEPDPDDMRGFIGDLEENAPPEIKEDAATLAQWFNDIIDQFEDDPDAQLNEDDIPQDVRDAQASFQAYIEENCPQYQPTPAES